MEAKKVHKCPMLLCQQNRQKLLAVRLMVDAYSVCFRMRDKD